MALKAQPLRRFHPFYLLVECAHLNVTAIGLGIGRILGTYFVEPPSFGLIRLLMRPTRMP